MKKISSRFVLPIVVAIVAGFGGWLASEWIPPGQFAAAETFGSNNVILTMGYSLQWQITRAD